MSDGKPQTRGKRIRKCVCLFTNYDVKVSALRAGCEERVHSLVVSFLSNAVAVASSDQLSQFPGVRG